MSVSTVPAVLDELVARWRLALPEVQVLDGGPHRDTEDDVICVGFQVPPGAPSVEDTRTRQQLASSPDREQYEITCLASSWRGEEHDAKAVRDRVYEMLDVLAAELERDPRLGGLVMRARLSAAALAQEQTNKGATATVRFVISVDAFAGR